MSETPKIYHPEEFIPLGPTEWRVIAKDQQFFRLCASHSPLRSHAMRSLMSGLRATLLRINYQLDSNGSYSDIENTWYYRALPSRWLTHQNTPSELLRITEFVTADGLIYTIAGNGITFSKCRTIADIQHAITTILSDWRTGDTLIALGTTSSYRLNHTDMVDRLIRNALDNSKARAKGLYESQPIEPDSPHDD